MHRHVLGVPSLAIIAPFTAIALLACSERTPIEAGDKPHHTKPAKDDKPSKDDTHDVVVSSHDAATTTTTLVSGDAGEQSSTSEGSPDSSTQQTHEARDAGVEDSGLDNGSAVDAATDAEVPQLPGALAFATDQILDVQVTLSEADRVDLEEHGNLEEYVPAQVTINGQEALAFTAPQVGIRHKGAYSLHHCFDDYGVRRSNEQYPECTKLSYKLKFDEYDSETLFDGLKRLNLHASSGDATMLRELLAYSTFRDFGVDAPRTNLVRLSINGAYAGFFIGVEDLDGRYAAAHYPEGPEGNLFKEVWPVTGQPNQYFMDALETNEDGPEVSDMQAFAASISLADAATFESILSSWVDLEAVLRYIVVDRASKNWDGIMAFYSPITPHNFSWYHDTSLNPRFHLIPWDLDNTFWAYDPYMAPQDSGFITVPAVPDWHVTPANCEPRIVWEPNSETYITPPRCDRFLDLLAQAKWDRFLELGHQLLGTQLSSSVLETKLLHWQTLMQPLLIDDPYLDEPSVAAAQADFRWLLDDLVSDFGRYLTQPLEFEEVEPHDDPMLRPLPTPEELSEPHYAAPLDTTGITNFEYLDGSEGMAVPNASWISDELSTAFITWNQDAPLADSADLRFDFTHNQSEGAYSEWVNLMLTTQYEVDLRDYTQLELTMRADQVRSVRIRLYGSAYDSEFGGAWSEFGDYRTVDTEPTSIILPLHDLAYPTWASDVWGDGQGWSMMDDEALERVLATFGGLIFVPGALLDAEK